MVTSEGLHSKGARQTRPGKGKRWNSLGFSILRVAVPTPVTYTLAGGRHFTFSSWDNTEEKADWRKEEGRYAKQGIYRKNVLKGKYWSPQSVIP